MIHPFPLPELPPNHARPRTCDDDCEVEDAGQPIEPLNLEEVFALDEPPPLRRRLIDGFRLMGVA